MGAAPGTHLLFLSRPLFEVPVEVTEFIERDLLLLRGQREKAQAEVSEWVSDTTTTGHDCTDRSHRIQMDPGDVSLGHRAPVDCD